MRALSPALVRMTFPDITAALKSAMPALRGRLLANQSLAELTWFRVGGPAQVLFMPEDESDLAYALAAAHFWGAQPPVVVAVTGTNGKTTTVRMIAVTSAATRPPYAWARGYFGSRAALRPKTPLAAGCEPGEPAALKV